MKEPNMDYWDSLTPEEYPAPWSDDSGDKADAYRDSHPGLVCVYGAGRMTPEQVHAEMSRLVGFQLTRKQALGY